MSARRLAIRQPDDFALSAGAKKKIDAWVKKYPKGRQMSAIIPALWIAQKDAGGWIPEKALRVLGDMLGMPYIRVYEVATFYTMFNLQPVGKHLIQMCGTTPCWLRGSDAVIDVLKRRIGLKGAVSEDGNFTWMEVECLGACANAPMAQISNADGDDYYEDLTAENIESLLDDLAAGKTPKSGPQNDRYSSEPEGGAMTLKGKGHFHSHKFETLPNCDKKTKLNYYEWDPKERRATKGGWVDPKKKASSDPAKRKSNLGEDMTAGIDDNEGPEKARPKRASKPAPQKMRNEPASKPAPTKGPKKRATAAKAPKVLYTEGATDGVKDDLKKISGVGPKFEGELNANGVYYFRQIGAWKVADVKVVEGKIKSLATGRVKRDDWIKQAKALAKSAAKKGKA